MTILTHGRVVHKQFMEKIIDESPKEISNPSGSSSSGSYYQATTPITKKNNDSIIKVDNLNSVEVNNGVNKETVEPGSAGITGNVAGSGLTEKNWVIIGGVLIVLVIIIIFVYNKQKNTRVERI